MKITLGKFREGLVAISGATSSSELEVEFYDGKKAFWTWQPLFPEEKFDYIWNFSTATVENILYVFGLSQFLPANKVKFPTLNFRRVPSITQNGHYWGDDRS